MSEVKPVLNQINIVANDFASTVTFYRRLGVALPDSAGDIQHTEAHLPNGQTLEIDNERLASIYNAAWALPTREAVDAKYRELVTAGYRGQQVPYDTFWGARYAIVRDPAGNAIGLMSPLDPERRQWPPSSSPDA